MSQIFYYNAKSPMGFTYDALLEKSMQMVSDEPVVVINDENYFVGYARLIAGLARSQTILFHDPNEDLSQEEYQIVSKEAQVALRSSDFDSVRDVFNRSQSVVFLRTSGTTGKPKIIKHTLRSLLSSVVEKEQLLGKSWMTSFHPYHMAGIQVFFQALMTKSSVTYVGGSDIVELANIIQRNRITNISSTPTFFRQALSALKGHIFNDVVGLSFGGERFPSGLTPALYSLFPKAKIRNIFATTESGSLFVSDGEYFRIREEQKNLVRIGDGGELQIHISLLGGFSEQICSEWYQTGDIVELDPHDEYRFFFVNRISDFINVGGYKVNPLRVEAMIAAYDGVNNAVVIGRSNSVLGTVLVAKVEVASLIEFGEFKKGLLEFLKSKLQPWEVPLKIEQVQSIEMGRTGKVKRT